MKDSSGICCQISSEVTVGGISLLQNATVAHFKGDRFHAKTTLEDGREHVAKLTQLLDELALALAKETKE